MSRCVRILLEEAIYAAEDFAAVHGYVAEQPRLSICLSKDEELSPPRRHAKLAEMAEVTAFLKTAEEAT